MTAVAVVGAGLTGLAAAHALASRGMAVAIYEAAPRAGGAVRTEEADGFLLELGPTSFARLASGPASLLAELGLAGELVQASPLARHRYIVRGGRLVPLPTSPPALLFSSILSPRGKLRLLREPFVSMAPADSDESVGDFVRRRFGAEVLDYLVNPLVAGVYAGDPERLGIRAAFPALAQLEEAHGSVLRGALAERQSRAGGGRTVWSLRRGIGHLVDTLVERLGRMGARVELGAAVTAIAPEGGGWMVRAGASATRFDRVIYAAPAHAAERIELRPPLAELAAIARIEHPPVSVVALGFRAADVTHPLDGFGVLVPEVEGLGILGAIFSSTLFPDRAPEGHVLVTAFVGGTRHPAAAGLPDQALIDRVVADLRRLVGVRGAPVLARVGRWPCAIPQYAVGHQRLVRALDRMEQQLPGFYTAGTYRDGIAIGDALASGQRAAERLLRDLGSAYVCATTTG